MALLTKQLIINPTEYMSRGDLQTNKSGNSKIANRQGVVKNSSTTKSDEDKFGNQNYIVTHL